LMASKYPWYKERLKTKYSKDFNPTHYYKNWTFLKSGLDDFRDGFPKDEPDVIIKPNRGPSPLFTGINDDNSSTASSKTARSCFQAKNLSASERLYSTKIPAAERKWRRVLQLEENLLAHPLALFPDLEQGLNPELYEEIVDILDPDLLDILESDGSSTIQSEDKSILSGELETSEHGIEVAKSIRKKSKSKLSKTSMKSTSSNDLLRHLQKKRLTGADSKTAEMEEHENKIKQIAQDFCKWTDSLGEGGPTLEEETIEALFASGYSQAKQTSGPVHVVELNSIPPELRVKAGLSPTGGDNTRPSTREDRLTDLHASQNRPKKIRYGAWYLEPDTWEKLENGAPLVDPEEIAKRNNNDSAQKITELHTQISKLHGAKAFRGYLEKNNRKKPEFMKNVIDIQDSHC